MTLLPCLLGDASPRVVRLGRHGDGLEREIWLLVHRELRHTARIRLVLDFIAEEASARADELAGAAATRRVP